MSKDPKSVEVIEKHVEELSCDLTDEEWAERATRQANVEGDLDRHTAHEANVKADLKATRARLEAERGRLAQQVRSHSEIRPVEVEAVADFRAGVVRDVRVDTRAVVRSRALTDAERQGQLRLHDEGRRAGKGRLTDAERSRLEALVASGDVDPEALGEQVEP